MLYTSPWVGFKLTSVVIGNCKSIYHPVRILIFHLLIGKFIVFSESGTKGVGVDVMVKYQILK